MARLAAPSGAQRGGVWGALAGALEAGQPGAAPGRSRRRSRSVMVTMVLLNGRLDVGVPGRHVLPFSLRRVLAARLRSAIDRVVLLVGAARGAGSGEPADAVCWWATSCAGRRRCCLGPRRCRALVLVRCPRTGRLRRCRRPGRSRSPEALDVHGDLTAQVALDLVAPVDDVAQAVDLLLGQVPDTRVRVDVGLGQDLLAGRAARCRRCRSGRPPPASRAGCRCPRCVPTVPPSPDAACASGWCR